MKIIKRNGAEEVFDIKKIVIAVTKADSSSEGRSLTDSQIEDIAEFVEFKCNKLRYKILWKTRSWRQEHLNWQNGM